MNRCSIKNTRKLFTSASATVYQYGIKQLSYFTYVHYFPSSNSLIHEKSRWTISTQIHRNDDIHITLINQKRFSTNLKKLNLIDSTKIRNVAIIAHVDHGKTTLVDKLLKQGGEVISSEEDRIMDYNDLEKERGITIMSKVTRVQWKDYFFNLIDTPGHSDFGGEVERVLNLIDGVCLIVDIVEGPKNQTKYVLRKSLLNPNCKTIVVMNKFDKPNNTKKKEEIENEIFDLFVDLNAPEECMNYPILYASAKNGWCTESFEEAQKEKNSKLNSGVVSLFEKIVEHIPPPSQNSNQEILDIQESSNGTLNNKSKEVCASQTETEPLSMLISMVEHQENMGITAIGKIYTGVIKKGDTLTVKKNDNKVKGTCVVKNIFYMKGRTMEFINYASAGDIVNISFSKGVIPSVNDTIVSDEKIVSKKVRPIDPPVLSLKISQNSSPLTGQDGKHITLSSIGNRLKKEASVNVAIEICESDRKDSYEVKGRGELQLGILIEQLRREGYEMTVSSPSVIYKTDEQGNVLEPVEEFHITIPSEVSSNVIDKLNSRRAEILDIQNDQDQTCILCTCPSRNFFGMRSYLREVSKGTAIINSDLKNYQKKSQNLFKSDRNGVIISSCSGVTTAFSLDPIQMKGILFVNENWPTYEGMIIGEHFLSNDIEMNCVKPKPVQSLRNKGHEENIRINHKNISIEYALSFIQDDEEIEVTPKRIVLRKKILNTEMRKQANKKMKHSL